MKQKRCRKTPAGADGCTATTHTWLSSLPGAQTQIYTEAALMEQKDSNHRHNTLHPRRLVAWKESKHIWPHVKWFSPEHTFIGKNLVVLLCYRDFLCMTTLGHKCSKRYESPCRFTRSNYVSKRKKKQNKNHCCCTNAHHSGVLGTVPRVGVYLWLRAAAG